MKEAAQLRRAGMSTAGASGRKEQGYQGASDSDLIEARLRGASSTSIGPRLCGLEQALSRTVYEPDDKAGAAGDLCFLLQHYKKLLDVHAGTCRK